MNRAYSVLEIKSLDADQRVISGIATTPEPDRVGDVIEPKGAKFTNPSPLLLHHDSRQPVGQVRFFEATDTGIQFQAHIPDITEPGKLKDRVDEAWASVKAGLIRGVSIGFRSLENGVELLKSGGLRFTGIEILELSLVTVPANSQATITHIRSIDALHRAASGDGDQAVTPVSPAKPAGVSASRATVSKGTSTMKTISEQIESFTATKSAKIAKRDEIMQNAATAGVTLDAAQGEEYETLDTEIKDLSTHLSRLVSLEAQNKAAAIPVAAATPQQAAASRGGTHISVHKTLPPGMGMARAVICKMAAHLSQNRETPLDIARARYRDDAELELHLKTSIAAGTTTDATWAAPLVDQSTLASEFIEFLRPMTIIGKFGTGNIPSLRRLPFNIRIPSMTGGFTGYWVGEGLAKPMSKGAFDAVTVPYTKAAALTVITKELARFSNPAAEAIVRDQLAAAVVERLDRDFINPDIAAISGVKPASITNGVTALSSAGATADNARTDITNLIEQFILNNYDPTSLVLIMPSTLGLALSVLVNALGQREFSDINMRGGSILGIPVITSQYAASAGANGNMVIALNANDIGLADDGQVSIDISSEASIEMSDAPAGTSATPTASSVVSVSMFQTNSLAVLAERFIHWKKLRSTAVSFIDDVTWGAAGSPA